MALLTSPIDGSVMRQIRRYGIELDVCPTSGGVWLDKGELEKLVAFIGEEMADVEADRRRYRPDRDDTDDHDDDFDHHRRRGGKRRSRFMDIFDF